MDDPIHDRSKRSRRDEGGEITITQAALHFTSKPANFDCVEPADQDAVLRSMTAAVEQVSDKDNRPSEWSVKPMSSEVDGRETILSYHGYLCGYKHPVSTSDLHRFQTAWANALSHVSVDFNFVSSRRSLAGAVVLIIPSTQARILRQRGPSAEVQSEFIGGGEALAPQQQQQTALTVVAQQPIAQQPTQAVVVISPPSASAAMPVPTALPKQPMHHLNLPQPVVGEKRSWKDWSLSVIGLD